MFLPGIPKSDMWPDVLMLWREIERQYSGTVVLMLDPIEHRSGKITPTVIVEFFKHGAGLEVERIQKVRRVYYEELDGSIENCIYECLTRINARLIPFRNNSGGGCV